MRGWQGSVKEEAGTALYMNTYRHRHTHTHKRIEATTKRPTDNHHIQWMAERKKRKGKERKKNNIHQRVPSSTLKVILSKLRRKTTHRLKSAHPTLFVVVVVVNIVHILSCELRVLLAAVRCIRFQLTVDWCVLRTSFYRFYALPLNINWRKGNIRSIHDRKPL